MLRRSVTPLAAALLLASLVVPAAAQDKFVYGVPSAISSAGGGTRSTSVRVSMASSGAPARLSAPRPSSAFRKPQTPPPPP